MAAPRALPRLALALAVALLLSLAGAIGDSQPAAAAAEDEESPFAAFVESQLPSAVVDFDSTDEDSQTGSGGASFPHGNGTRPGAAASSSSSSRLHLAGALGDRQPGATDDDDTPFSVGDTQPAAGVDNYNSTAVDASGFGGASFTYRVGMRPAPPSARYGSSRPLLVLAAAPAAGRHLLARADEADPIPAPAPEPPRPAPPPTACTFVTYVGGAVQVIHGDCDRKVLVVLDATAAANMTDRADKVRPGGEASDDDDDDDTDTTDTDTDDDTDSDWPETDSEDDTFRQAMVKFCYILSYAANSLDITSWFY